MDRIVENIILLQLLQAIAEEEDLEALLIFLDFEKAFDRCSWDYLSEAIRNLGFPNQPANPPSALTVDNNVEMWLEKHSCVSASVEYFAGFSIVTLIFGPNFPDFGQLRPILVDFGRLSPIQGRVRSRRAKGNHQPPTQLQRLP